MSSLLDCCPLCGSTKSNSTAHPLYLQCQDCSVVYQFREINRIDDYYDDSQTMPNCTGQIKSYRCYLKVVDNFINLKGQTNIIDIGAADGTFLDLASKLYPDCQVCAIEHSEKAKTLLKQKGISLIELSDLVNIKSKCIFSFQVLEHIAKPKEFIHSLHLTSGDFLILTSPAVDSVFFIRNRKHWRSYSPSYHLLLYSRSSLEYLLKQSKLTLLYYDFCYSRSHTYNRLSSGMQFIKSQLIWALRICVKGYSKRPRYHGRSSFLAIARKD